MTALNDGGFVLLQFVFTNAGIGDQRAACRALWVPPGEAGINQGENTDRSGWSYNAATDALGQAGIRALRACESVKICPLWELAEQ